MEILRKGQKMTLQVTVGRLSEDEDVKADLGDNPKPDGSGAVVLGLKLSALTDELRKKYGIAPDVKGAIVDDVDPKSPAAASIKAGDVIVQVANEPVVRSAGRRQAHRYREEDQPQERDAGGRGRQGQSSLHHRAGGLTGTLSGPMPGGLTVAGRSRRCRRRGGARRRQQEARSCRNVTASSTPSSTTSFPCTATATSSSRWRWAWRCCSS